MTEGEWLAANDPDTMLQCLQKQTAHRNKPGRRKLRLAGCACADRVRRLMTARGRGWLNTGERLADGRLDVHERREAAAATLGTVNSQRPDHHADSAAWFTLGGSMLVVARASAGSARAAVGMEAWRRSRSETASDAVESAEGGAQAALLRDIFGNPFRPVPADPSWLTSAVVALAQGIYGDKAFDRLPILADALQDAGCDNEDVLSHCRGDGPHVRGCWVVDLLLGKV